MYEYIIGSGSQDGKILIDTFKNKNKIVKIYRNKISINNKNYNLDINKKECFYLFFKKYKPSKIYYFLTYHVPSSKRINTSSNFDKYLLYNFEIFKNILSTIKKLELSPKIFYSSSCFIFNGYNNIRANEKTIPKPNCEYGISKYLTMNLINYYRKKFNLFIIVGILFNHESHLRSKKFFIPHIISKFKYDKINNISIYEGYRDWCHAEDVVRAIKFLMKKGLSEEYIICSGNLRSTLEASKKISTTLNLKKNFNIKKNHNININKISGSNNKLLSLGFKFKYSFEKMILRIYDKI